MPHTSIGGQFWGFFLMKQRNARSNSKTEKGKMNREKLENEKNKFTATFQWLYTSWAFHVVHKIGQKCQINLCTDICHHMNMRCAPFRSILVSMNATLSGIEISQPIKSKFWGRTHPHRIASALADILLFLFPGAKTSVRAFTYISLWKFLASRCRHPCMFRRRGRPWSIFLILKKNLVVRNISGWLFSFFYFFEGATNRRSANRFSESCRSSSFTGRRGRDLVSRAPWKKPHKLPRH